jgi:hypothetical protein
MNLIQSARTRLAVIAPAITTPVAQALAARMADLPALSLTVILDADAEVYRMGYGDAEALEIIRKASFAERWKLNPPSFLKRRSGGNDPGRIREAILDRADELFKKIVDFAPPDVDLNYKGIVIEDIEDAEFRTTLRAAMEKARVDTATLDRLFQSGDAAAVQGGFDFSQYN